MSETVLVSTPTVRDGTLRASIDGNSAHWAPVGADADATSDAPTVVALARAMIDARPLRVTAPMSARLRSGIEQAQDLLVGWYPHLHEVTITGDTYDDPQTAERSTTGLFFSGGVDAFYSLLTRKKELSHLVLIRGFDVKLGDEETWEPIRSMGRAVSDAVGVQYVEVKTNTKKLVRGYSWSKFGHGCVLAGVGLSLQDSIGRMIIASTREPDNPFPCGTHPDLDHLWSTERITFEHDTLISRVDKVDALLSYPLAMKWLRVCWRRPDRYNCGECEKCIRTMIQLKLAGGLDRCETLPSQIDLHTVESLPHNHATLRRSDPIIKACDENGLGDVADALRRSINAHAGGARRDGSAEASKDRTNGSTRIDGGELPQSQAAAQPGESHIPGEGELLS